MKTDSNGPMVLEWLFENAELAKAAPSSSLLEFMAAVDDKTASLSSPIDRAVAGGFLADRVGFAFAAGYQAAQRRLVPGLPENGIVSFCVSEEGGGHPRMIQTRLVETTPGGGGFLLSGKKTFITAAIEASRLLVAASEGTGVDGKNLIKMVLVERDAPGVTIARMPDLPFVPEISHGFVTFANTPVPHEAIFPGDGYVDYIKPFRTIEDIHVLGAVMGYLFRVGGLFSWPHTATERLSALIAALRALAGADPLSRAVHIALAGVLDSFDRWVADTRFCWESADEETRSRWERDKKLLSVADKARQARLAAAWSSFVNR